jgi:hypothetical protein
MSPRVNHEPIPTLYGSRKAKSENEQLVSQATLGLNR